MCQTFAPEAIFHNERSYEKLRVLLHYSGIEEIPEEKRKKQMLLKGVAGWSTWKEDDEDRKQKNEQEIAEFRKIERTIIQNASREVAVEEQLVKNPSIPRFPGIAPLPNRPPTPTIAIMPGRRRPGVRMVRNMSPFNRTGKTLSETPKQFPTPNTTPRIPVITPFNKSGENQTPPGGKKSIETVRTENST
ncbi:hypothetical protein CRE_02793 [Caenorhabditis remanei]|uniref:Uncharacterized protein n=1 Tax=Caenorhabditis remanei TaxID=31234 RepID=E3NWC2_CAERE|nr:hypothetical protein CRE_02793 [Caenorhabditis remanei]